jgi:hypothetical protein
MKSPRIVRLAIFAIVVFGSIETAFADISGEIVGYHQIVGSSYGFLDSGSFITINVAGVNTDLDTLNLDRLSRVVDDRFGTDGSHRRYAN